MPVLIYFVVFHFYFLFIPAVEQIVKTLLVVRIQYYMLLLKQLRMFGPYMLNDAVPDLHPV